MNRPHQPTSEKPSLGLRCWGWARPRTRRADGCAETGPQGVICADAFTGRRSCWARQRAPGESKAGEAQSRGPGTVPGLGQRASPSILGLIGLAVETSGARRVVFELGKLEGALPPPAGCIAARGARGDGCLWFCRCRVRFTRPKAAIQFPSQSLWIRGAFRRVGRLVSARVTWRHPSSLKWPWRSKSGRSKARKVNEIGHSAVKSAVTLGPQRGFRIPAGRKK